MSKYSNITGQTFGKLTAIKPIIKYDGGKKHTLWLFRCSCGNTTERPPHRVALGWVTSCGCISINNGKKYFGEQSIAYNVYYVSYSDGDLTFDLFLDLCKQKCYYCGIDPSNCRNKKFVYNGLDRLDNSLPHNFDNVVPCCIDCNKMKSFRNLDEFLKKVEIIYKHRILNGD